MFAEGLKRMSSVPSRILGISGSLSEPSRTTALVKAILGRFELKEETRLLELAEEAPVLFATKPKGLRAGRAREIIESVETADLLVVGSPVYRASYTGALKHLFDLVDYRALEGTPVLVCATGGTPLHGLMPDQQFRPLFAFFKALVLPTSVYALESDFDQFELRSGEVFERIDRAVAEARRQLALPLVACRSSSLDLAVTA